MKRFTVALLAVLIAAPVAAGDSYLLLIRGNDHFLLDLSAATPTIMKFSDNQIIRTDGTTPPPADPRDTATAVKVWADTADEPFVAKAISMGVYSTARTRLESDLLTWAQVEQFLSVGTTEAVKLSAKPNAWATFRTNLSNHADNLKREGKLSTKAQQLKFLEDVEKGLNGSSANAAIDWAKLIEFIKFIIQLITTLFPPENAMIVPGDMDLLATHRVALPQPGFRPIRNGWVSDDNRSMIHWGRKEPTVQELYRGM